MKSFADRLKYLREEMGLTQKELAKICNVSPQCICCLEQETRNPTGSTVAVLARTLNTSADYLLGLEDDFGIRTAAPMGDGLSSEERKLLSVYQSLSPDMRETLWSLLATWTPDAQFKSVKN